MPRKPGLKVTTLTSSLLCLTVMVLASLVSSAPAQEKSKSSAETTAKLVVLYRTPRDPAEFDRYYAQVHIPLAKKIPGLRRLDVTRVTGAPGGASDLYLIAELYFDNPAARDAALASNEAKATEADLSKFAEGIVSVYFGIGQP
jgi:uncharacterized protein (TIGR02118 family)